MSKKTLAEVVSAHRTEIEEASETAIKAGFVTPQSIGFLMASLMRSIDAVADAAQQLGITEESEELNEAFYVLAGYGSKLLDVAPDEALTAAGVAERAEQRVRKAEHDKAMAAFISKLSGGREIPDDAWEPSQVH